MILPRSPTHTFFTPLFTNPANRHSHDFGVNSPLNRDHPGDVAHCQATLTGSTSLWDVRGEPAICSIMDFGPKAGDWTLKLNSVSYNWNFVTCMFPNRSTWHSQTMMKIKKKKKHFHTLPSITPPTSTAKNKNIKKYTPVLLQQLVWCSRSLRETDETP